MKKLFRGLRFPLTTTIICAIILMVASKACHTPEITPNVPKAIINRVPTLTTIKLPIRVPERSTAAEGRDEGGVTRPERETRELYIPPEGKLSIETIDPTKNLNDVIKIDAKTKGFCFLPGAHIGTEGYGLSFKLMYWNRFGVSLGGSYGFNGSFSDSIQISYHLDRLKFSNLEAFCGLSLVKGRPQIGLRINF